MHAPREAGGRRGRWWRAREGDNLLFREQLVKCEHHHQSGALARAIGTIAVSCRPSPALLSGFIASCCVCCSYTRTGRRRTSLRFLTMGTRNHTHLGLLVITYRRAAFVNTLKTKTDLMVARAALSPPSELVQGVAMSTSAVTPFRSFVQTPIFSVPPSSFSL